MAFPFGDPHPCSSIPILVIDGETSFSLSENGKTDPSPFNENNIFVSCGYKYVKYNRMSNTVLQISNYLCFNHNKQEPTPDALVIMQQAIDEAELLVGHNLKFDLEWLAEAGFNIEGKRIWDTMIAEYVLGRGDLEHGLSLDACLRARNLGWKSQILEKFIKEGYSTEDVPWDKLSYYGEDDIEKTHRLFEAQIREFYDNQFYASYAALTDLLKFYEWEKLIDGAIELRKLIDNKQGTNSNSSNDERNVLGSSGDRA